MIALYVFGVLFNLFLAMSSVASGDTYVALFNAFVAGMCFLGGVMVVPKWYSKNGN